MTYIGYNGVSVVDYVLTSEHFLVKEYIHSFTINDLTELSDHRPLNLQLKYPKNITTDIENPDILLPKPRIIKIKDYNIYKNELQNEMNQNNISQMISKIHTCKNKIELNNIIKLTTELYIKTAIKINPISCSPSNKKKTKSQTNKKTWYDNECTILKRQLNKSNK